MQTRGYQCSLFCFCLLIAIGMLVNEVQSDTLTETNTFSGSELWKQFYIIVIGEPGEQSLDPRGDVEAIRQTKYLVDPVVIWNPTPQQIFDIPHECPIIIISHTTNETFLERANESEWSEATFDWHPMPPTDPASEWKPGDMFMWGWPEPQEWINVTETFVPAKTQKEAIYPYVYHPLVLFVSCFGLRFEHPSFSMAKGISEGLYLIAYDEQNVPLPTIITQNILRHWVDDMKNGKSSKEFLERFDWYRKEGLMMEKEEEEYLRQGGETDETDLADLSDVSVTETEGEVGGNSDGEEEIDEAERRKMMSGYNSEPWTDEHEEDPDWDQDFWKNYGEEEEEEEERKKE